jgi:thiol-disulfide isomerase/thioredoxin
MQTDALGYKAELISSSARTKAISLRNKIILILLLISLMSNVFAQDLNYFTESSLAEIKKTHLHQPFILILWSIDCVPCYQELNLLSRWLKKQDKINMIIVSTDAVEQPKEILDVIKKFQLSHIQQWVFSDDLVEGVRFSIDPNWYGELPRSYFFDKNHHQYSHSGTLTEPVLKSWMSMMFFGQNNQ